ncbi:hypothetical protein ANMWB30_42730 [Arthrobacter sp. MWB30]|nr:hypothetical protein ANMWB30_42730 [Arthrobacter sp. MWB30]
MVGDQDEKTIAIARASREWKNSLIDVGGTNRLLHFKKTSATLDFEGAAESALVRLLRGAQVKLADLYPEPQLYSRAQRACTALYRKQREATEEYGVSVTYLAAGFATWNPASNSSLVAAEDEELGHTAGVRVSRASVANAPVLLRPLVLERKRGTQDSWELSLVDDFQVNAVLLHVLNFDQPRITEDQILAPLEALATDGSNDVRVALEDANTLLKAACTTVDGFGIDPAWVMGAFSYQKQPMVSDVENLTVIGSSDLVSALAGDSAAATRVRSAAANSDVKESDPDYSPVDSEYLVLDADASQSYVVNAALAGRNLVVQGPPGTGKSQTIANTIAALMAAGKSVLFVAQKRAAITAVLNRLSEVDLSHLLLDLFAAEGSRRLVAEQLGQVLDRQGQITVPDVSTLEYRLTQARDRLVRHKDELFQASHAWGVSVHDLRVDSAGIPVAARSSLRLPASTFDSWGWNSLEEYAAAVDELFSLGALSPSWHENPGWRPRSLASLETAQKFRGEALDVVNVLLPDLEHRLSEQARLAGYGPPPTLPHAIWLAELHSNVQRVASAAPELLSAPDLDAMLAALSKEHRRQAAEIGWGERRKAKKHALAALVAVPQQARVSLLLLARSVRADWRSNAIPAPAPGNDVTYRNVCTLRDTITSLDGATQGLGLNERPLRELAGVLASLAGDQRTAQMVRANELEGKLRRAGLGLVLEMLAADHQVTSALDARPGDVLRWVTMRSILEHAELASPQLAGLRGADLEEAAKQFRTADTSHLEANAARVRRRSAEYLKAALDAYPHQHSLLKTEITRRRNFRPIRRLFQEAPDVLLASKPVWAMSPLQVSRLLPTEQCFDVVIFDEASQVKPADAIPSLLRGRQAIVAGDSRQLPPTEFFSKVLEDDATEEPDELVDMKEDTSAAPRPASLRSVSFTRDAESILFAMDRLLAGQSRSLQWHYRSKDEQLIAVSNEHVYSRSLTTFPAADAVGSVQHVEVPPSPGIGGGTNSPEDEVRKVVELVRQHLAERPEESIGIITFGIKHEDRIERALEQEMQRDADFERALNASAASGEPWFVKAIERVQGDERDAIILTVGYGKGMDGKLRYFWGPLLKDGGDRRLNVAISRAKKRMTLVTSFSRDDVPDDGHPSAGYRLMYHFLRFMASGGTDLTGGPNRRVPLNPFEIDILTRLEDAGLKLDPQVGVGGYRIDFAARHPDLPGRHVLAIEADGASYHSGHTARERDRLRQSMLERRGWRFHRIWSTDWFNDADREIQRAVEAFSAALADHPTTTDTEPDKPQETAMWNPGSTRRTHLPPQFTRQQNINDYPEQTLVELVAYIRSDGILRPSEEELRLVMSELGFSRRGIRIDTAIRRAQAAADAINSHSKK